MLGQGWAWGSWMQGLGCIPCWGTEQGAQGRRMKKWVQGPPEISVPTR